MKREIITTADGTHTVSIPEMQVTYHSHHGAVQESMHVFIGAGLRWWLEHHGFQALLTRQGGEQLGSQVRPPAHAVRIFEMGFGTGLNAYLTALEAAHHQLSVEYTAVEKFPLLPDEASGLNYGAANKAIFDQLHCCNWNRPEPITQYFTLEKQLGNLQDFSAAAPFHIIYFDAFAPTAQPELWTEAIFSKLYQMLHAGCVLVTYCSKGVVRRAMQAAGFEVTKIPGPPGKREMVRAIKPLS